MLLHSPPSLRRAVVTSSKRMFSDVFSADERPRQKSSKQGIKRIHVIIMEYIKRIHQTTTCHHDEHIERQWEDVFEKYTMADDVSEACNAIFSAYERARQDVNGHIAITPHQKALGRCPTEKNGSPPTHRRHTLVSF